RSARHAVSPGRRAAARLDRSRVSVPVHHLLVAHALFRPPGAVFYSADDLPRAQRGLDLGADPARADLPRPRLPGGIGDLGADRLSRAGANALSARLFDLYREQSGCPHPKVGGESLLRSRPATYPMNPSSLISRSIAAARSALVVYSTTNTGLPAFTSGRNRRIDSARLRLVVASTRS